MRIAIGSMNKAKIRAVERALVESDMESIVISIDAPSSVSGMPFSDMETMEGAINRAEYCCLYEDINYGIGLEGGVMETTAGLFLTNWGALAEKGKPTIVASGARIKLPEEIASRLRNGEELGPVMDEYNQQADVRSNEGAIGTFTNGLVNRDDMFIHIIKLLLGQRARRRSGK